MHLSRRANDVVVARAMSVRVVELHGHFRRHERVVVCVRLKPAQLGNIAFVRPHFAQRVG